jgi:hypothetical protein
MNSYTHINMNVNRYFGWDLDKALVLVNVRIYIHVYKYMYVKQFSTFVKSTFANSTFANSTLANSMFANSTFGNCRCLVFHSLLIRQLVIWRSLIRCSLTGKMPRIFCTKGSAIKLPTNTITYLHTLKWFDTSIMLCDVVSKYFYYLNGQTRDLRTFKAI